MYMYASIIVSNFLLSKNNTELRIRNGKVNLTYITLEALEVKAQAMTLSLN